MLINFMTLIGGNKQKITCQFLMIVRQTTLARCRMKLKFMMFEFYLTAFVLIHNVFVIDTSSRLCRYEKVGQQRKVCGYSGLLATQLTCPIF